MQVLGLSSKADSEAVSRSYKLKLREAAGDDAQKQRIESAHSSIMMASLTSRLQVLQAQAQYALQPSCQERVLKASLHLFREEASP